LGHTNLNASRKYQELCAVILFSVVYLVVGVAFPNPPASNKMQFLWRLAAWLICAIAFAIHIGLAYFRFRTSPRKTSLHAAMSVALGAFALAAAANIHALTTGRGNRGLLALALLIWPVITGVPAFVVAFVATALLARVRPNRQYEGRRYVSHR
jgi:ABC-type transport system involved in cytochrome c biogenesis permease component